MKHCKASIFLCIVFVVLFVLGFQDIKEYTFSPANYTTISAFASGFLHLNRAHLFSNCISLLIIGYVLEDIIGAKKFVLYFVICSFLSFYFLSIYYKSEFNTLPYYYNVIGASGGLCGLEAFVLIYAILTGEFNLMLFSLYSLVPNLSFELKSEGVSVEGHIAGAVAGVIVCFADYLLYKLKRLLDSVF